MVRFFVSALFLCAMLIAGCHASHHSQYRQMILGNWSGINSAGPMTISFRDSGQLQVDYRQMGGELVDAQYRFLNDTVLVITPVNDTAVIKQLTAQALVLKPYHPMFMEFMDAIFVTNFTRTAQQ